MTTRSMKSRVFAGALGALGLMTGGTAQAQATASDTATGSVTIIQPLTIAKDVDLAFGRIVKPASGSGSVTIANTSDTVTAAGGAVALPGITTSRAKFTIAGEGGQAVTVSVPASFNMLNGSNTIAVALTPDLSSPTSLSGALGSAGGATLYVGGNFSLPAGQATGLYTGTFNVSVAYQ